MILKSLRVFFFDLDGVLWVGKENPRYVGGKEVVQKLKDCGRTTFVLTNDSTHVREEIHQNLTKLGFSFAMEEILTSSYLTARYLSENFGKASFYLIGEDGIKRELEAAGHYASTDPEAVVVGLDRQLTYEKLDSALRFLRTGARLVGSYGGAVYMSDRGPALSAGPIIKALEFASGKRAVMIGKPSPRMFTLALQLAGEKASKAVMIGDQIETDIVGARKAGLHTILVLTGVETRESVGRSKVKPDMVINNLEVLETLL
ncbi:MAG: HAD-IIA family hydrolase [Candidatus Bathyarchaeia archaeon]